MMEGISIDGFFDVGGTALWTSYLMIMGTLSGVTFTIYKHLVTQRDNKKMGFINRIEHYEKELRHIADKYHNSEHNLHDCIVYADNSLVIMDKISYLKKRKLLDEDTIEYFRFWFAVGQSMFDWLTKIQEKDFADNFPYFIETHQSIVNKAPYYKLDEYFNNFLMLKEKDSKYHIN